MGFFDLDVQEERSFLSVVRHTVLEGPQTLIRFSDSGKREQGAYGKYWMYGSEVAEALSKHEGARLIREIRRRWAVSTDWGNLEVAWALHLPEGRALNAYWGFAKFQPKVSSAAQKANARPTTKSYQGGSIQLVLNIGPEERRWITGPFRAAGLSAESLGL